MFLKVPFTNDIYINENGMCRYTTPSGKRKCDFGFVNKCGYQTIKVGKSKFYYLHRLVARMFVPNPCPELFSVVHHLNCIRSDNRACNLQWTTPALNASWRKDQNLVKKVHNGYKVWFRFDKKIHKLHKLYKNYNECHFAATNFKLKLINEKRDFLINQKRADRNICPESNSDSRRFSISNLEPIRAF